MRREDRIIGRENLSGRQDVIEMGVVSSEQKPEIFLFGKKDCPLCQEAKKVLSKMKNISVVNFDLDALDGLSKAAYHNAFEIPVTIIIDKGREVKRWQKESPDLDVLNKVICSLNGE